MVQFQVNGITANPVGSTLEVKKYHSIIKA